MKTRLSILDLGTNTFHLLIADIASGKPPILIYQDTIAVKLGEGGLTKGQISDRAFSRGIEALRKFKADIVKYQTDQVRAVATSAIRSAKNGKEFIQKARLETDIVPEIINGDQEAELIYRGVRKAVPMNDNSLIIDIGGGSVEFIICNNEQIFWKKSYPLGAARLIEQFHHSDPISKNDRELLYNYFDSTLIDLKQELTFYKPSVLIGSAGAFETFAAMAKPAFNSTFEKPGYTFNLNEFEAISMVILNSTHDERVQMPEIIPVRTDMIVVATLLTKYVLEISAVRSFKLSCYSLKEGILFKYSGDY
jgi:exopolyphosphatase/guanosine-5'-triphosphate,3'-diphosphate pyrophosphatase